jgi:biopolymer transport protein ExbD
MKVDLLDTPREDVRMEIIPLIDVIFCILTFSFWRRWD